MKELDDNFIQLFNSLSFNHKSMNFFDIISPKEVLISEWLSFILNPSINGVGNLPVQKLLDVLEDNHNLDELNFISTNTEVSTDKNQRIDILIKYEGLWIVIENKIDSLENGNQTEEYYKYIESIREENEAVYIYLKPNYNSSIPKEKEFRIVTYNQFMNRLKEISEFDYKEKDRYKYLKEFIISGDRFMRNEELDYNETILFYMNNIEKISRMEEEYRIQNKRLHEKLRYDILNELKEYNEEYLTDDDKGTNPRVYMQFFKKKWNNDNHMGVHYELIFGNDKLLSPHVKCSVVLHLEGHLKEEQLEAISKMGITRSRNLAYDNNKNEQVLIPLQLNMSSAKEYDESRKRIIEALMSLINQYESLLDRAFDNENI